MKCTLTREGNVVVQSESDTEDFALRGFCEMNRARLEECPILFCFDHRQNFEVLVENSNKEAEEMGRRAQAEAAAKEAAAAKGADEGDGNDTLGD